MDSRHSVCKDTTHWNCGNRTEAGMARIQLVMGEEDRERFVEQAKKEGMSLNAWMHAAGME